MSYMTCCLLIALGVAPPADTRSTKEHILALGSDEYRAREEATRRLMLRHDAADTLLTAALHDPDPEVKRRATRVATALRAEQDADARRRAERLLRAGRADLAVALLVESGGIERDSPLWLDVKSLVKQLSQDRAVPPDLAPLEGRIDDWFKELGSAHQGAIHRTPHLVRVGELGRGVVFSHGFDANCSVKSAVFTTRSFRSAGPYFKNLAFTTAGSATFSETLQSVIVCGGDVTFTGSAARCLIVARGAVHVQGTASRCVILANGPVTSRRPAHIDQCVVRQNTRGPLNGVRFFELDEFGLTVSRATADTVGPGVFREAGLRAGDRIVTVGGEEAGDAESIRALFSRHFLRTGPVHARVTRGAEELTLYVPVPEPLR